MHIKGMDNGHVTDKVEEEEEEPYTFLIHTGLNYPQQLMTEKWHDGTMILTINPGSETTQSKPLRVKDYFPADAEGTVNIDFWLPATIGEPKLLKVDLKSNILQIKTEVLYVREVTILYGYKTYRFPIKNFVYPHNPTRWWCSVVGTEYSPYLLAREGPGTLRRQETEDFIIEARDENLRTTRLVVAWNEPGGEALLYPGYLACVDYEELPRFLKFREAKMDDFLTLQVSAAKEVKGNVRKNLFRKIAFTYKESTFDSFEQYTDFLKQKCDEMGWSKSAAKEALKVAEIFQEDEEFGRQMLCGPNSVYIRKLDSVEERWVDGMRKVPQHVLEGRLIEEVIREGRLFEITNDALMGIPHGGSFSKTLTGTAQTWYVILADCMFYVKDSGALVPVLIRLQNKNDGEAATFWNPPACGKSKDDPEYLAWLLAKMYFRCADMATHACGTHTCRVHGVSEVFAVAAFRNLPNAHPMFRLLQPHIQAVIAVNVQKSRPIILTPESPKNSMALLLSAGDNAKFVFENFFKTFSYQNLLIPNDIEHRGVKDIPEYLFRDDTLAHWELLKDYVAQMVNLAYPSDEDVMEDGELQNFATEAVEYGFRLRGFEDGAGFPRSLPDKETLTELLTAIIFNVSVFHEGVNFQVTSHGYMPNAPSCVRMPPPKEGEDVTMERILNTLPVSEIAFIAMNISYNLSKYSPIERFYLGTPAENKLGFIGENMTVSPEQVACINRLTKGMEELKKKIEERNRGRHLKYDVFRPDKTPLATQS